MKHILIMAIFYTLLAACSANKVSSKIYKYNICQYTLVGNEKVLANKNDDSLSIDELPFYSYYPFYSNSKYCLELIRRDTITGYNMSSVNTNTNKLTIDSSKEWMAYDTISVLLTNKNNDANTYFKKFDLTTEAFYPQDTFFKNVTIMSLTIGTLIEDSIKNFSTNLKDTVIHNQAFKFYELPSFTKVEGKSTALTMYYLFLPESGSKLLTPYSVKYEGLQKLKHCFAGFIAKIKDVGTQAVYIREVHDNISPQEEAIINNLIQKVERK